MKKRTILIVILILGILLAVCGREYRKYPVTGSFAAEDITYAAGTDGMVWVADQAGSRLVKIEDGQIKLSLEADRKEKGFYEAMELLIDEEGNLYVKDVIRASGGFIKGERIVKYSADGKYLATPYAVEYEKPVMTEHIAELCIWNGEVHYLLKAEDSISLYDIQNNRIWEYGYEGLLDTLSDATISPVTGELILLTKSGNIHACTEDGQRLLYSAEEAGGFSVPWALAFDTQGRLYFTDLGDKTVKLCENGEAKTIAEGRLYYYNISGGERILAATSEGITELTDKEAEEYEIPQKLYLPCRLGSAAGLLGIVLGAGALLYLLLLNLSKLSVLRRPSMALGTFVIVLVVLAAGIFIPMLSSAYQKNMIAQVTERASRVTELILMDFPLEEFQSIREAEDIESEAWQKVSGHVRRVLLDGEGVPYDLYCSIYYVKDNGVVCSYMLEENTGAFYPYDWSYEGSDEQLIAETGEGIISSRTLSEGSFLYMENPIFDKEGNAVAFLDIGTDLNVLVEQIEKMIFNMVLNVAVVAVLVILISMEAIIFWNARKEWKKARHEKRQPDCGTQNRMLRIVVFLIFFLTNISVSYLPLYAIQLAESSPMKMIPMELMAAIPISSEVIFTAIFSVCGDVFIRRMGQRKAGVFGAVLFTAGLMMRFIRPDILLLIVGNAVMGAGQGIILLIINAVIARGDEQEKNDGFADYSAASLNGINSGAVFGGFLVIWFSYHAIFVIIGVLSVLVLFHFLIYLADAGQQEEAAAEEQGISLFRFLTAPRVLVFFAAVVVPIIAFCYYTTYLFPIIGEDYGLNETYVGYAYLLNGLPVICFSNYLTNVLSEKLKKEKALMVASGIYIFAFVWFALVQNVVVLLATMMLLGLSDSFGLSIQNSYYTDMDEVKRYGYEKSIGIYNLFDNIAQTIGSFIFSYVIIIGVRKGLFLLAGFLCLLSVLFILTNLVMDRRRRAVRQSKK